MEMYFIRHGLGPTMEHGDLIECESQEQADKLAYELACEDYESYAGLHGIPDMNALEAEMNEAGEEYELEEAYAESRESWIDYFAELYDPEKHDHKL